MMEVMLDSKGKCLESKRSCQGSGFNFFQAILSGSMVRAKRREVRRCLHKTAMLGDECDEDGEKRWYDVRREIRVKSDPLMLDAIP